MESGKSKMENIIPKGVILMTEEIEIFNAKTMTPDPLLAAIDKVAPLALQSVAGNEEDTVRVNDLLAKVKEIAGLEGRPGALQYLSQMSAQFA